MAPQKKNVVETLAFVNPTIVIPKKGNKAERRIKFPRGWQITTSEKYPVDKHNQMLVDLAKKNGGQAKMMVEISVNLNQKSDEPLDTTGIELIN